MNQIFGQERQTKQNNNFNNGYPNNQQLKNNYYYANNNANNYSNYDYEEQSPKKRKIYNKDITKILMFFCILNIIYGLTLIGSGVWGIQLNKPKEEDKPKVTLEKVGSRVTIQISTVFPIQYASYRWNSGAETEIPTTGLTEVSTAVKVIEGNNILNIKVTDKYGNDFHYKQQYIRNTQDDVDPVISVTSDGANITITATDDKKIEYVSYKWGEEDETIIRADENLEHSDGKTITVTITARRGSNLLVINAQDADENMAKTVTYNIQAADSPTIELSYENGALQIHMKDDVGLKTLTVVLDGQEYTSEIENNPLEFTASVPVSNGQHDINITVTNINGYESNKNGSFNI